MIATRKPAEYDAAVTHRGAKRDAGRCAGGRHAAWRAGAEGGWPASAPRSGGPGAESCFVSTFPLERKLRDARATSLMGPANDLIKKRITGALLDSAATPEVVRHAT
jgi:hypothetical protein